MLTREERNEAREGVEKDFETEIRVLKKRKKEKRVQNKNNSTEDDLGLLFGDGITGKLPRFANKITLKVCSCLLYSSFFLHYCCTGVGYHLLCFDASANAAMKS